MSITTKTTISELATQTSENLSHVFGEIYRSFAHLKVEDVIAYMVIGLVIYGIFKLNQRANRRAQNASKRQTRN